MNRMSEIDFFQTFQTEKPDQQTKSTHFNLGFGFPGTYIKIKLNKIPGDRRAPVVKKLTIDACYEPIPSE